MRLILTIALVFSGVVIRAEDLRTLAEFPFQYREGLLWAQVKVPQSPEPLSFLLDSGANVSVIHLATAKRLGLKLGERVSVRWVQATTEGYWPQRLAAKAGDVKLPRNYLAMDLSALGRACDVRLDGLLGADFFRQHLVQIDFSTQKVRLLKSGQPPLQGEVLPLETRRCGLRIPIRVNGGEAQWVRLDTGCATPLQWVTSRVDPKNCMPQMAVALTQLSIPTTQVQVQIGSTRFESVAAGLHEQPIFAGESGLLGNGLLSRFKVVTIDCKANRIMLQKAP